MSACSGRFWSQSLWREVAAKRHLPKVEIEQVTPAFEHAETEAARAVTDA